VAAVPTYEYACTACAERIEVVQRFTDAALTECAACGGTLRKVFSPVGVVFKGSGFYKTDSRSKPASSSSSSGDAKPASTPSTPAAESSGGSSGESSAAPAAAPAPAPSTAPAAKAAS
jgi:putative FmdB family regulatory protein